MGKNKFLVYSFFGDSLLDNGNNNFLHSSSKANYPPYGIDYPTGPIGRFSNGKNYADFLVEFLGFKKPIPPFATAKGAKILKGVNYASGGGGILDETGRELGDRISMNWQLINHGMTAFKIALLLENETTARDHLNKCLYVANMGSNDYLNNYLLPKYFVTGTLYTPEKFAAILINQYRRQLTALYNYGARKVAVFGLGLLAYVPQLRSTNTTNDSSFIHSTNEAVQQFNNGLKLLIDDLNTGLDGAQFVLINSTYIAQGDPSTIGIKVTNVPCCVVSNPTGLCDVGKIPCNNRNEYYFWDNVHPTETVNYAVATRSYAAASPSDAYPTDIRNLVLLK